LLIGIFSKGFNWGIDFTGGSVIEINYTNTVPTFEQVQATVKTLLPEATVQKIGDTGFLVRTTELNQEA
jgi:preprotein translocase subunit SecF